MCGEVTLAAAAESVERQYLPLLVAGGSCQQPQDPTDGNSSGLRDRNGANVATPPAPTQAPHAKRNRDPESLARLTTPDGLGGRLQTCAPTILPPGTSGMVVQVSARETYRPAISVVQNGIIRDLQATSCRRSLRTIGRSPFNS